MNAMLTEFTLANFKSYSTSRLPLGSLTVLIGANAAGKSNALEGLRFLSWLAQGQKLSSIQYAVNSADRVVRGRVNDLCHRGESNFTIGCRLDSTEWNQLDITLSEVFIWSLDSDIKSGNIGIIHLSYLPLCSLRSLWLNHSDAAGNDMTY
ncbi:AAA family ATPase [Microcoleus sp. CAWBG640]|uniref:AAA family ATPase n=1 Tax=Microcoleus sp. CAWBG640 TaxID=2841653 RepID=UPI00312B3538